MSNDTLQKEIVAWAAKTFPDATFESVAAHLEEEWRELDELLYYPPDVVKPKYVDRVAEEAADVMHLLFQIAEHYGFDLLDATRVKFIVNKARAWGEPDPVTGLVKHVETVMTTTDDRVERVSKALYTIHKSRVPEHRPLTWEAFTEREPRIAEEYRAEARAAIEALDGTPSLEDVLREVHPPVAHINVVPIYYKPGNPDHVARWNVEMLEPGLLGGITMSEGTGPTIDAAIRAAVKQAKERG